MCYPAVSGYLNARDQASQISTYSDQSDTLSTEERKQMLSDARAWNEFLYQQQKGIAVSTDYEYTELLDIGNGIIGTVEIPKIDVNLAVYHGTDDDVLSSGAGHLEDSSLPVGGENTHTVITGHTGLPSAKLFTRLDEMKKGDLFYINVLNETYAYEVDTIETVLPEKADYSIVTGKDLATLVTCTPYGINSHRLLVTGHRVPYNAEVKANTASALPSLREMIFYALPVISAITGIAVFHRKKKKKGAGK